MIPRRGFCASLVAGVVAWFLPQRKPQAAPVTVETSTPKRRKVTLLCDGKPLYEVCGDFTLTEIHDADNGRMIVTIALEDAQPVGSCLPPVRVIVDWEDC